MEMFIMELMCKRAENTLIEMHLHFHAANYHAS